MPYGTHIRGEDEAHEVDEHASSLAAFGPSSEPVVSQGTLLEGETLLLLVAHAVVVHRLQGVKVHADGLAREEAGRKQHRKA